MTVQLAPLTIYQAFYPNGSPLAGGQLFTYVAGTSTPQATYTDSTGSTPNTNPVILNASGQANLWLNPALTYKFVLEDKNGNIVPPGSIDNIPGGLDIAAIEAIIASATVANSLALNGIPAINYARQSRTAAEILAGTIVQNTYTGVTNAYPYVTVTDGATVTINCQAGDSQILTLGGNRTMAAPINPADGQQIDLLVVQDATGNRTLTWNAVFVFENNTAPVLSTAAGGIDRFLVKFNAALGKHVVGHFGAIGAGNTASVTVTGNTTNFNLFAALGQPGSAVTANVTISPGTIITSANTLAAAMDLSGMPSGSTINLTNLGYIIGLGGNGANGGWASYPGSGTSIASSNLAGPGGPAINGPGSSVTFNLTNGSGHIWGGGGGGGGGGAYDGFAAGNGCGNAGGGGGGAGGGIGGIGGLGVYITGGANALGGNGISGTIGISGAGGAAGTGTAVGTAIVGVAGAGGAYGTAGSTGVAPTTATGGHTAVFSGGGAAGKAIALNGGTATFVSGNSAPNVIGAVS